MDEGGLQKYHTIVVVRDFGPGGGEDSMHSLGLLGPERLQTSSDPTKASPEMKRLKKRKDATVRPPLYFVLP